MSEGDDFVRITCVRILNFRALRSVEVHLDSLTVLIGANNAGKSTFLDALYMALGTGRKTLGSEDIYIEPGEPLPPKDRKAIVDVLVRPVDKSGAAIDKFPRGSYWTALWGDGIAQDAQFHDFMGFRSTLAWDLAKGEYGLTKKFLKEWRDFPDWPKAEEKDGWLPISLIDPISLHYIDAKRDLDEDLRRPGSFWRRLMDDLGLDEKDVSTFEEALSKLNQSIVDKSDVLKHIGQNLADLQHVVGANGSAIDIAPVARRLRDLSRGVDVSFSSTGSQAFPLTRHGMGTRSLASLLVFRAFVSWKAAQLEKEDDRLHAVLALEEPEAHLHPQAQRALYAQIKSIPGQRLVSTHSAYFAGQADLAAIRLFLKQGSDSTVRQMAVSELGADERRQLERMVLATRGDLLFSRALVLFEGETEEQALPIWAEHYWGKSVHELGFSFVGIGGGHYFPFVWLAQQLGIKWYVFSDGEDQPVRRLSSQLKRAGFEDPLKLPSVIVLQNGDNLEKQLIAEGYAAEIESALDSMNGKGCIDNYVSTMHGQKLKGGGVRDYQSVDGRKRALLDMLEGSMPVAAAPVAREICQSEDGSRQTPRCVQILFEKIGEDFGLKQGAGEK